MKRPKFAVDKDKLLSSINKDLSLDDEDKDYPEFELIQVGFVTFLEFILEKIFKKDIEIPIPKKIRLGICSRWVKDKLRDGGLDIFPNHQVPSVGDLDRHSDFITLKQYDEKWDD